MKMHDEHQDMELEEAVRFAAKWCIRLRTVHGSCPAAIVFGAIPTQSRRNMVLQTSPSTWLADVPPQERFR